MELHFHFRWDRFPILGRPIELEVHSRQLGLVREQSGEHHSLGQLEQGAVATVFGYLEHDRDEGSIER